MHGRGRRAIAGAGLAAAALTGPVAAHEGGTIGLEVAVERAPPGGTLPLIGEDWAPGEPLRITIMVGSTTRELGIVKAGADGHFVAGVILPRDLPSGPADVDARSQSGVIERAFVTIDPNAPDPSPRSARPGPAMESVDDIDVVPFVAAGLAVVGLSVLLLRTRRAATRP